jgi:hypothetical protein
MTSYDFEDKPIKEIQDKPLGKKIDRKIKDFEGYVDLDELEDFEEEIETFERIRTKTKKKKGSN